MLGEQRALSTTVPNADSTEAFTPGTAIGRFLVLSKLGSGGMGVVYAAYDPDLDRKVAIKLLRGNRLLGTTGRDRDRLMSEAQAMARLAHPHVVAVYELGFTDEAAFLVMEHVTGRTLRDWLHERERPWPEVVAMFVAAGQGLAAAHRERIVHRDFKPANVLLDRDGRPRVADFGLAAAITADGSPVTAGAGAGTRRYMAPEQLRGDPCDARADQFAFCVALWHAVHGSWPFAGETPAELAAAIIAGRLAPPARRTPEWLRAALTRGLAADAEARWSSLDDLLRVLGRERGARRRWIGGGFATMALGAALWLGVGRGEVVDPCAGAGAASRFAGIWDGPRQAAVMGAFYATGLAYADDTWQRVKPRIDGYVADWSRMATETCRATRVEGRQSDTLMDLRMRCLDEQRSVLGALTELWIRGVDGKTLERALDAAGGLPPISACANERALSDLSPLPTDPARARMVAAVRPKLDLVKALVLSRRLTEGKQRIPAVRSEADATGWDAVRAEAALLEGQIMAGLERPSAAGALYEAVRFAGAAHDDYVAARAMILLVEVVGVFQQKLEPALQIAEIAEGAVSRAGNDPVLRSRLSGYRGQALWGAGKGREQFIAAREAFVKASELYTAALGADAPETVANIADLAGIIEILGDYTAALALHREALTRTVTLLGPNHPVVGDFLRNVASVSERMGDHDVAADYYRRSLDQYTKGIGTDNVPVVRIVRNLGAVETSRGRLDDAQALLERALADAERLLGPDSGFVGYAYMFLGDLRRKQGRYSEAFKLLQQIDRINAISGEIDVGVADAAESFAAVYVARNEPASALDRARRALEIRRTLLGTDHPTTFQSMAEVAAVLARMQRCAEARPLLDGALAGYEKIQGMTQWGYQLALATLGECELTAGAADRAAEHAERAVALARGAKEWPVGRGQYRWVLVRALWALGRRDEAIATARQAERELAADADGAIDHAAVRAWLAAHAGAARASGRTTPRPAP